MPESGTLFFVPKGATVQGLLCKRAEIVAEAIHKDNAYVYVCRLRGLEEGVEAALGGS